MSMETVERLWKLWTDYKDRAEQHDFVSILMVDRKLIPLYEDLHKNWDQGHAEIFASMMREQVFPYFGIKE
jgi:hypothetical protein